MSIIEPPMATRHKSYDLRKKYWRLVQGVEKAFQELNQGGTDDDIFDRTLAPSFPK